MAFHPDERIGLFIDGANLHTALRGLNIEIDYRKLLDEFRNQGRLIRAVYYTAMLETQEVSSIKPLVDWLSYNGYVVSSKPAKEYHDPITGRTRIKGDMDVNITVDALAAAKWLDHLVLFSGDGDFCPLVAALQQQGVRVSVVSTALSSPSVIADALRRQADNFIELADLAKRVARPAENLTA